MNAWFADTFFFFALLDEGDEAHSRAVAVIRGLESDLLTTPWVLTEVADGLAAPGRRTRFVELLRFLRSHKHVVIVPADQDTFDRGVDLYAQRPDKDWSLTDCMSFVVMQQHGITDALTADRHFEQAGFNTLLK